MTKRFSDSELWNKDWFLNLSLKQKLLVKYIFDACDCAGVYEISYRQLENIFGEKITKEDFLSIKQVKFIAENKIFIEDFIEFQYGVKIFDLNEKYSVHKGILKKLNKINYFETLTQPLANSSLEDLQDKVKDKDKVINQNVEEKEKNKKEKEKILTNLFTKKPKNPDLIFDKDVNQIFELYQTHCKSLIPLMYEKRDLVFRQEIKDFLTLIKDDFDYFGQVCKKANELKFIVNKKIDLKSLIKNHSRIYSGFYTPEANISSGHDICLEERIKEIDRQRALERQNE